VDLLAELEQRCNGGDWTQDPWFLRPEQQAQLQAFDFSPIDLVAARDALAIVYPPAVCRTMLGLPATAGAPAPTGPVEAPPEAGLVAHLFWQMWPWMPLLGLGVDLALVRPWDTAGQLVNDLRRQKSFDGAELEVQVWANALRAGWGVERSGRMAPGKKPDLLLEGNFGGSRLVRVEIKSLGDGQERHLGHGVELQALMAASSAAMPQSVHVAVKGSVTLQSMMAVAARRHEVAREEAALLESLVRALRHLAAEGWPLGEHPFEWYGTVIVETPTPERPPGGMEVDLFSAPTPRDDLLRVIDRLNQAGQKVGVLVPGIAFVDAPMHTDIAGVAEYVEAAFSRGVDRLTALDAVIVRTRSWDMDAKPPTQRWVVRAVRSPRSRLAPVCVQQLRSALAASPHRLVTPARPSGTPAR
jgi:hypothetical protein